MRKIRFTGRQFTPDRRSDLRPRLVVLDPGAGADEIAAGRRQRWLTAQVLRSGSRGMSLQRAFTELG